LRRDARARRDLLISIEALAGRTHTQIADRHGVCERTVRRAIGRAREASPAPSSDRGVEELHKYWLRLEQSIEDLGFTRLEAPTARSKVAAIDTQTSLMKERLAALIALGIIPAARSTGCELRVAVARKIREGLVDAARKDGLGIDLEHWLERQIGELAR
jgi:hypothetical protein